MDDDKVNQQKNQLEKNQSKPLFETVPETTEPPITPEEVSADVTSPSGELIQEEIPATPQDIPPIVYQENKNKYFVIIGAVIFFFLLLVIFLKFIFGSRTAAKEVNLTYWGLWEDKEIFIPLIEAYRQKNPHVKIDYIKRSPQDYRDKLLARSRNKQGPDIFRFHNTWLPQLTEIIAPLPKEIMSNNEFEKTFYKIHQKDLKIGNRYFGLPLMIDGLVLIYNENLFKKAGILQPPVTWDELTEIVPKLTVKDREGRLITAAIAIGTATNVEHFSDIFALMLVQNGGDIRKLDQSEAVDTLEAYRKFAEEPQNFWTDDMPNSITAFIQEKVAMLIVPSWEILVIKAANPEIALKVAPVPVIPGLAPVSIANYWVEGVSLYSQHQLEAWKFLRFLVEKENLTKLYELQARSRLFGEPYSRVDLAPFLAQNEYLGPLIKQADNFVSVPAVSRTYDNGLNDEIIKYLENAINATAAGVSYSEALKTAKMGVDQIFNKYKIE